jgi:hypothetical protein
LPPVLAGIAQDVDEILPRFRGELDWLTEGHRDRSAGRYAWRRWRAA